jgi:uncharacterized protein YdaL
MRTRQVLATIGKVVCWLAGAGCAPGSEPLSASHGKRPQCEGLAGPANAFPADRGPVPEARGQDSRPAFRKRKRGRALRALPSNSPAAFGTPIEMISTRTLVLYDDAGAWGSLGELYALAAGHLASHFGTWSAMRVADYQPGDMLRFTATIYIGSTYDQPLPVAFLDDVLSDARPVVWMYDNIWQLANRAQGFAGTYGWDPWDFDTGPIDTVLYKGVTLSREATNGSGIMRYRTVDPARASVLASAVRADGTSLPWALRAKNLTYIGEIPFTYIDETDRYLAFCDLLFDALAPATPELHQALVRIEDVSAKSSPAALMAIADYLHGEGVPFSIALIPLYVDPRGVANGGVPERVPLSSAPAVVGAIEYMIARGGTVVMHGYTHQYEDEDNPYTGVSAADFEFWRAHVDAADYVVYDGHVGLDSPSWAATRVSDAFQEITSAGLSAPTIFEYPHYAGSATDSQVIVHSLSTAFHRGLYFGGTLSGAVDESRTLGQFFPYVVRDIYGFRLLPETLGAYVPVGYNHHPSRLATDIVAAAEAQRVIRDNVAGFYFHPFEPLAALQSIVQGLEAAGYTFVSPADL